jgi:hypothetical protein
MFVAGVPGDGFLNKPLDERQKHIADLARQLLPFLERGEKKSKLIQSLNQAVLLFLFIFLGIYAHEYIRPINAAEEKSLKALLEHAAEKTAVTADARIQEFLDRHKITSLNELPYSKWKKAVLSISKN